MDSDKELFESSLTDEPIETQVEAQAEPEVSADDGIARDDKGRFASKAEPEPVAVATEPVKAEPEANVPSWRLREQTDRAEAAEKRAREIESNWQRQFNELQNRLPKPEEPKAPDVFEDPNKFLEHGVRQAVDPIRSEIGQLREFYSQREATREHGAEKVKAAYDWVAQGMQNRDPAMGAIYQRAMSSMDPYGEIIKEHQKTVVYGQIGNDPQAWFEKELERRMADPQFASSQLQKIQQGARNPGTQKPGTLVQLPPSISRVPSAQSASDDVGELTNESLFAHAMR